MCVHMYVRIINIIRTCVLCYRGLRTLISRQWRFGSSELYKSVFMRAQLKQLQKYVPSVTMADISRYLYAYIHGLAPGFADTACSVPWAPGFADTACLPTLHVLSPGPQALLTLHVLSPGPQALLTMHVLFQRA